jgi:CRP-like cAMP-binding protein
MADADILRALTPIASLRDENFKKLLASSRIEKLAAKQTIFKLGDNDKEAVYLLSGEVNLVPQSGPERMIVGGSPEAKYALAQLKPRQFTGVVAKGGATIARVDSALLDRLLVMDQTAGFVTGFEVEEIGGDDGEWVFGMMQHPTFERLPAASLSALFGRLSSVDVKPGQVIIRQGDPGDYYYIIKSGRVSVSRKSEKDGKVVVLSELKEGDGFGEEALVSGAPRNANVISLAPGTLMRLTKADFEELLREPLVKWVTLPEAQQLAKTGAGIIDVRTESEFTRGAIKGAVNIPLYMLRMKAKSLEPARKYVTYCETGARSAAAAFLLTQRGFDVCVLRGGLAAVNRG